MLEGLLRDVLVEADRRNEDVLVRAFDRDSKPKPEYIYAPYIPLVRMSPDGGKLRTTWCLQAIADLKAVHGINVEKEDLLGHIDPWDKEICSKCDDYKPCHCDTLKATRVHDTRYCTPSGCNWCGECYTRKLSECDLHHRQDCPTCA